jgi:muramoyltetrapeptide carboxypeptidase LdcA involved in peptidoglycan recycling
MVNIPELFAVMRVPTTRSRRGFRTRHDVAMIRPPALKPGDTVAAISLSSGLAAAFPHRYAAGKRQVAEKFGVTVIETPNALRDNAWLHDNPQARADDLHWALENDEVAGVISTIGGDESIRTVPYIDVDLIRRHPKVFLGFSDSTIQHLVNRRAGVVSFHGPGLLTDLAENGGIHPYVEAGVRAALFSAEPFELEAAPEWTEEFLDWANPSLQSRRRRWWPNPGWQWLSGSEPVTGELIGGCGDVLEIAKGSAIWPPATEWDGAVFLFETSEEAPTPDIILHWLRGYLGLGVLERLGALLLGRPMGYPQQQTFRLWQTVLAVLAEAGRPDLPVVANVDYGHTSPAGVLPLGCRVQVDPLHKTIAVVEPGVG